MQLRKKVCNNPHLLIDLWLVCFSRCNVPGKNCMIGVFIEWQTVNGTSNYRFLPFSGQILLNFLLTTHHYALTIIYYNRYHNNTYALMLRMAFRKQLLSNSLKKKLTSSNCISLLHEIYMYIYKLSQSISAHDDLNIALAVFFWFGNNAST